MSTPHIDLGIVVRDIDACLPFYRDTLGLSLRRELDVPGGSRIDDFAVGDCALKLVTHKRTPDAANPPGGSMGGPGLRYRTLGTDDIEAAVARCEAAGAVCRKNAPYASRNGHHHRPGRCAPRSARTIRPIRTTSVLPRSTATTPTSRRGH
jgi:catechol 2,3-dioxygenase-like lactoylglutathione lyase family enzyme